MRKILVAFDGNQYSEGAMQFAKRLNQNEKVTVNGLFLPQVALSGLWSYADAMTGMAFVPYMEGESADVVENNIKRFEKFCSDNGMRHSVSRAFYNLALPELRRETRFSDLLILGSETFYQNVGPQHSEYLKDALHTAECPVVVVPESYKFPESNILAYDGSESSVFAIKQFVYLFPELSDNPTTLVTTGPASDYSEKKQDIRELVSAHFSSLSFLNLDVDAKKYFATWMAEKKSSILVCGAFSRSMISQLLRQSFVEDVLRDHKIPVFISHR
ncbi:MAG: hypothetical protein JNK79_07315 [Chitinophagaceae bacterium]|nr:hypothetical protein [Chitinophagaceae bacterium]